MATVHGSFVPAGPTGFFFLWGLDPEPAPGTGKKGRWGQTHPQAIAAERLYPALRGVPFANALTIMQFVPTPDGLRPVRVPGIALSVAAAAQWLLDIDTRFQGLALKPGRSLHAWSAAAKLLLEMLGRGRLIPVLRAEPGSMAAGWSLCQTDPWDA
ncbi:MAG TPA: hypothetical protein VD902_03545, partial [Symbiobacteriaceae bacterium]|nr:hypothetical protein [Symbiobacteriaceae bacterium]